MWLRMYFPDFTNHPPPLFEGQFYALIPREGESINHIQHLCFRKINSNLIRMSVLFVNSKMQYHAALAADKTFQQMALKYNVYLL